MACRLLLTLCVLASAALALSGTNHENTRPRCEVNEREVKTKIITKKPTSTTTFYVKVPHHSFGLMVRLTQRNCLDQNEEPKVSYVKSTEITRGHWDEVQLIVDDQGYRLLVNGGKKLNIAKKSGCSKVLGVDVDVAPRTQWSLKCDPRTSEETTETTNEVTSAVNSEAAAHNQTKSSVTTTTYSPSTEPGTNKLFIFIYILISLSVIIILLLGCMKWHKSSKRRPPSAGNAPHPPITVETANIGPAENRTLALLPPDSMSSLPPVLPPPFGVPHAQSMILTVMRDVPAAHVFPTMPLHRACTPTAAGRVADVTPLCYEDASDHIYEEMDEAGSGCKGEPLLAAFHDSHESINSVYGFVKYD